MTTAHRPTWNSAIGTENGGFDQVVPSQSYSARSISGHNKLKVRQPGQGTQEEIKEALDKQRLEEKEKLKRDRVEDFEDESNGSTKKLKRIEATREDSDTHPLDRDDSDSSESEDESDYSDDSDDEDMTEIQRELEFIKMRQEKERLDKEKEKQEEFNKRTMEGNPILSADAFKIKKKWYEETVFRNQARDEPKYEKKFINDTTRNDFHKRFLSRYIK